MHALHGCTHPGKQKRLFSGECKARCSISSNTHGVFAKMYGKERRRGLSQATRRAAGIFFGYIYYVTATHPPWGVSPELARGWLE